MRKVFSIVTPVSLSEATVLTARERDGKIIMEIDPGEKFRINSETISFIDRRSRSMTSFLNGTMTAREISLPAKIDIFETHSGKIEIVAEDPLNQKDTISTTLLKEYTDSDRKSLIDVPNHAWSYPESPVKKLPIIGIQAS